MSDCATCGGSGYVYPWGDEAEYCCPDCNIEGFVSASEFWAVRDGLSEDRVNKAERGHLREPQAPRLEIVRHLKENR